jgi:hypothetical protein
MRTLRPVYPLIGRKLTDVECPWCRFERSGDWTSRRDCGSLNLCFDQLPLSVEADRVHYLHTVTLLPNGNVLITGGLRGGFLSSVEL